MLLMNKSGWMQPLSALGAVNRGYAAIEASSPAIETAWRIPAKPRAVAVVETKRDGWFLADVSAHRLWRRDYMATLSSLNFAAGVDGYRASSAPVEDEGTKSSSRFSSRGGGFAARLSGQMMASHGGNAALTCRTTSSLAAVMAQMLSYRATHIWVTEGENDVVVGVVGYMEVLKAVTTGVAVPA